MVLGVEDFPGNEVRPFTAQFFQNVFEELSIIQKCQRRNVFEKERSWLFTCNIITNVVDNFPSPFFIFQPLL